MERLHKACQQTPPDLATIRALVIAYPSAVRGRSADDHWLPLHRACRRQPSLAVIQTLTAAWPNSVREWTADAVTEARLPIHLACQYGAPVAVVAHLAQQDPTCLRAVTKQIMYTALDFALYYYHQRRQAGLDVTEAERVVHYLANIRVEEDQAIKHDDPWEEKKLVKATILPTVHACPVPEPAAASLEQDDHQEEKPHAKAVLLRSRPPSAVPKSSLVTSRKSKIIRIKLPRPCVPLRRWTMITNQSSSSASHKIEQT